MSFRYTIKKDGIEVETEDRDFALNALGIKAFSSSPYFHVKPTPSINENTKDYVIGRAKVSKDLVSKVLERIIEKTKDGHYAISEDFQDFLVAGTSKKLLDKAKEIILIKGFATRLHLGKRRYGYRTVIPKLKEQISGVDISTPESRKIAETLSSESKNTDATRNLEN